MSDPIVQPVSEPIPQPGPGLSQMQRVIYTFTAPSKLTPRALPRTARV